jgi:hypothetical protein
MPTLIKHIQSEKYLHLITQSARQTVHNYQLIKTPLLILQTAVANTMKLTDAYASQGLNDSVYDGLKKDSYDVNGDHEGSSPKGIKKEDSAAGKITQSNPAWPNMNPYN